MIEEGGSVSRDGRGDWARWREVCTKRGKAGGGVSRQVGRDRRREVGGGEEVGGAHSCQTTVTAMATTPISTRGHNGRVGGS